MWNVSGQRWYLNLKDLSGNLIVNLPIIASPPSRNLQALSWVRGASLAVTALPHGFKLGSTIRLSVADCLPVAYNGIINALITGTMTFSYPLTADPGQATVLGTAGFEVNLVGGYFSSRMIFRATSQRFEVTP
jgi:hypothetical protein